MTCQIPGCTRKPRYPDLARCDEHRLRWTVGAPAEPVTSPWVRRAQANELPAKAAVQVAA